VSPPAGVTDTNSTNDSDTDSDTLTPKADLALTKSDGATTAIPGTSISYVITVTNNGPSTVSSLKVVDNVPATILSPTFTPSTGVYTAATGVWTGLSLASGQSITLTVSGTVDPTATGTLSNTATVSPPAGVTDTNSTNDSDTDSDTLTPKADLALTKSDGATTAIPGTSISYVITVTNNGPSTVSSLKVVDNVPATILSPTFTPSTGVYTAATGVWTGLSLASGQSITLTVSGTVDPTATGTLSNTATVSPPAGVTDT